MRDVIVYGKKGCGLCEAAKDKLKKMGLPFESKILADFLTPEQWAKTPEAVREVQACYADIETLPVIVIDGQAMGYPAAMKTLKGKV